MSAHADVDGISVSVRADPGETRAMTQDRAWAIARSIPAFVTGGTLDAAACEAACRAYVWQRHAGCIYFFSGGGKPPPEKK